MGTVLFSFEISFSGLDNGGGTINDEYTYKAHGIEFSISDYSSEMFTVNHNIGTTRYSIVISKNSSIYGSPGVEPTAEVFYQENTDSYFRIKAGGGTNPAYIFVTVLGIK